MTKKSGSLKTSDLGEREIIRIIKSHLTLMPNMAVPFGDDVSAVNLDGKRVAVLKTDMLVGKTDVPQQMSLYQAGRKAIIMNISDFASKGVQPTAALVALGLPRNFAKKDVEAVAEGLNDGAREYGANIIGGDTSETADLIISISLFGTADGSTLMLRSGAQYGDILATTGFFGNPSAGLRMLLGDCLASEKAKTLVDSVLLPKARLAEGLALGSCGAVTASMDSSDGLAWSLHELARSSNVGFIVDNVPVAAEAKRFAKLNSLDALELALYGGEEYELVCTVKPQKWAIAQAAVAATGGKLLPIGRATNDKQILQEIDGKRRTIEARGWEHFKSEV